MASDLEPLERALDGLLDVLRPAVQARRPSSAGSMSVEVEPEFGGDHHLLAEGGEGFAHQFFVRERTIDFGGVEEGDAAFNGRPNQRDHLLLVRAGRSQSSFPCSRGRWPRLPGCCFRVCAFAFVPPSKSRGKPRLALCLVLLPPLALRGLLETIRPESERNVPPKGLPDPLTDRYDAYNYLVLSVPLPAECETEASLEEPLLLLAINVEPTMGGEVMLEMDEPLLPAGPTPRGTTTSNS